MMMMMMVMMMMMQSRAADDRFTKTRSILQYAITVYACCSCIDQCFTARAVINSKLGSVAGGKLASSII